MHHFAHLLGYSLILSAEVFRFPYVETTRLSGYGVLIAFALVGLSHAAWHYAVAKKTSA